MIGHDADPAHESARPVVTSFQQMLAASRPAMPAGLIEEAPDLADLYAFQCHRLDVLPDWLDPQARRLLSEQGLPCQAAPFLSFFDGERAAEVSALLPAPGWAIGHEGGGNLLAIDAGGGEVVMWDHDNDDARVFVNRDLLRFAECLCAYAGCMESRELFLQTVAGVDADAVAEGAFWRDGY